VTDLYLCGAGNPEGVRLALDVAEHADPPRWHRIAILDDDPAQEGRSILGVPVVGPFSMLADVALGSCQVVNLVARTTQRRASARARIVRYGHPFAALVHPSVDARGAHLARDVVVYERAIVSSEARVGPGSVVFMGAVVGHGSQVGAGCVLAAGSVINARVVLAGGVYVGTNAAILPDVRVGRGATVGACSAVVGDVPAGATALGVPAELLVVRGACAANGDMEADSAHATLRAQRGGA
jgi:acetyltransferase-like isoleucine patch superfamily enzyme